MKSFKTPPKNPEFYSRYAGILTGLFWFGLFAQIVSGVTEAGTIYLFGYHQLQALHPALAVTGGVILVLIGVAAIEGGLRFSIPYTWRGFIRPLDGAHKNTDIIIRAFITTICIFLIFVSCVQSFRGSVYGVDTLTKEVNRPGIEQEEARQDADRKAAQSLYSADSAAIVSRYAGLIFAESRAVSSKKQSINSQINQVRAEESATGKSFRAKRKGLEADVNKAVEAGDARVAELEAEKAAELAAAFQRKTTALAAADEKYNKGVNTLETDFKEAKGKREKTVSQWGGGFGWAAILFQVLLFIAMGLVEFIHKGAGIDVQVISSQREFLPSISAEKKDLKEAHRDARARNKINEGWKAVPGYVPQHGQPLIDLSQMLTSQPTFQAIFEQLPPDQQQIFIQANHGVFQGTRPAGTPPASGQPADPNKALLYLGHAQEARSKNYPEVADELELKAEDILRIYLGEKATPEAVRKLMAECIDYLHGRGPNPFKRNGDIGFKVGQSSSEVPPTNEVGGVALTQCVRQAQEQAPATHKTGNCAQCGNLYQKRTTWQKYCSDQCRLDANAAKHGGTRYDPQYKFKN